MVDQTAARASANRALELLESIGAVNDLHRDALAQCRSAINGWETIIAQVQSEIEHTVKGQPEQLTNLADEVKSAISGADETLEFPETVDAAHDVQMILDHQSSAADIIVKVDQDAFKAKQAIESMVEDLTILFYGAQGVDSFIDAARQKVESLLGRLT